MKSIEIYHTISFPNPSDHYTKVKLEIKNLNQDGIILKMPTWTPGSYLIREFAKQVEREQALDDKGNAIYYEKTSKNSWSINTKKTSSITFEYYVYCFEQSVRTSWVDESHAFLNGANIFLYVEEFQNTEQIIQIEKPEVWKNISTALPKYNDSNNVRIATNYDALVDSPIEIGNHEIWEYKSNDITHEIAMYGDSNCTKETFLSDLKKITEQATNLMGGNPCAQYLFIIHNTDNKYGGLEHLDSTACHVHRWDYKPKEKYTSTMGLLAHEYFHLWNGKRIRPIELGPFDYENENYTQLLWVVEGFTSYYDDYILLKAGIITQVEYLETLSKLFTQVVNHAGDDVQSLAESSFDTWIKYYRQHEQSPNNQVSYYRKGACVSIAINMLIIHATTGKKSLDDVMRMLYGKFLSHPKIGYSEETILEVLKEVSGIDFRDFLQKHVHGTVAIDYESIFLLMGLELKNNAANTKIELGWKTTWNQGKLLVASMNKNYGAYQSGIHVTDEIISIDGYRVFDDFEKIYANKKASDTIDLLISRQGLIKNISVSLTPNKEKEYKIKPLSTITDLEKELLKGWLG